jgi:hypothetical protein|tara:strand:+ start:1631 stop:1846 length:216 start_codon:yes stop_codon:yes gene_type:complete
MDKYSNPDVFIVLGGFVAIILLGALLAEVAVFIAKILGYEDVEDLPNVDFWQRLEDGEVLDADNMFSNDTT